MKRIFLIWCAVLCTLYSFGELKYVFYFIGDGMGSNQVLGAEMYRSARAYTDAYDDFPVFGQCFFVFEEQRYHRLRSRRYVSGDREKDQKRYAGS